MSDERAVVVIGTGPAGSAAAWTLYRAGIAVTVLEAGHEHSARGLLLRAPGLTLLRFKRPLAKPETHTDGGRRADLYTELSAGGLSNHWTCAVPRFAPADFTDGARLDEKYRWPLSYQDLAAHYATMERLLHIGGSGEDVANLPAGEVRHRVALAADWGPIVEQASARGHGLTSLPLAYSGGWTLTRSGTPFNSYVRMIEGIPRSPRFRVLFGARALHLEWSGARKRVSRVVFHDAATGKEQAIEAAAFVVAAGALRSTGLLLQSTSADFPEGLGNTAGVLGRYLHDHPLAKVSFRLGRPVSIHPPVYLGRAPYEATPPLRGVASVLWSGTGLRLRRLARLSPDKDLELGFNLFGMLPPDEHNDVVLDPGKRDAAGAAALRLRLHADEGTSRMLLGARERLLEILGAAGLEPSLGVWVEESLGTSVHYGGTVRMHASPRYGMLDAWNRLHAVPNVLVVDSSSFTTGPEKNPTLTAMALAARAAERLALDLRASEHH